MKKARVVEFKGHQTPCWIVAMVEVFGKSESEIKIAAKTNGWDGQSMGLSIEKTMLTMWDLTGKKPSAIGTQTVAGQSPQKYSDTSNYTGLVFVDGHVMPCVDGRISNYCGYGNYPIILVVTC